MTRCSLIVASLWLVAPATTARASEPGATPPPAQPPAVTTPPVAQPPATAPAPVAEPPSAAPPVAQPPAAQPPAAQPPAAQPPTAQPPAAQPPAATPPAAAPPAVEPPATPPVTPTTPPTTPTEPPPIATPTELPSVQPPSADPSAPSSTPPETPTDPAATAAKTDRPPPPDDAAWAAMKDKSVVVERVEGDPVSGKLIAYEGTHAVVQTDDGKIVSVAKADVTALRVPEAPPLPPAPTEPPPPKPKVDDWKWHKLGLFTFHGVAYSRWRTPNYTAGGASYNLDAGIGINFSSRFGVYALMGGAVGAKIREKLVRANYGHFALSFLVRRKYVAFLPGIGLALSGRRGPEDIRVRETGLALPMKLMGLIPVKAGKIEGMHVTIGLTYDLAILVNTRPLNSIGLQVGVARF